MEVGERSWQCSGETFKKDVIATPRQSGYLETARAMYEYTYYKDEELTHAVRIVSMHNYTI